MSFRNLHYDNSKNIMYLWDDEVKNNKYPKKIPFVPHVYIKSPKNTGWKSIYGENVEKREFKTYWDYKRFCDDARQKAERNPHQRLVFENDVKPEIQFLVENYYQISDDDLKTQKLRIMNFDIEVDITKIDELKIIKCKIDGIEKECSYNDLKNIEADLKVEEILYFDKKQQKWLEYDERIFFVSDGFPEPMIAKNPVCMITVYDNFLNQTFTFGLKDYTGTDNNEPWLKFIKCRDEKDLLNRFLSFVEKTCPDVITGWNSHKFDLVYLITRLRNLYPGNSGKTSKSGQNSLMDQTSPEAMKQISRLSPIGIVRFWSKISKSDINHTMETKMEVDIAGVSILDYMDLYKMFSTDNLASYKLDFVANHELNKGKVSYTEYRNLTNLYHYNYNLYKEYNVVDVKRVKQISEKVKYIELVHSLSLLTKCPMKYYAVVTHLTEGAFLTYLRRHNKVAPFTSFGERIPYEAAYVKEPKPGLYGWNVDLDITSSYPTDMILLNMGLETYWGNIISFTEVGQVIQFTEQECVNCVRKKEFPRFNYRNEKSELKVISLEELGEFNKKLKEGFYAISPDGAVFRTDIEGTIAGIERYLFYKRVDVRKLEKEIGIERDKFENGSEKWEELNNQRTQKKDLQTSIKRALNSIYGALAVPYFRYFNPNIPKAITSCGRWSVKQGEKFVDELCSNPKKSPKLFAILNELKNLKKLID